MIHLTERPVELAARALPRLTKPNDWLPPAHWALRPLCHEGWTRVPAPPPWGSPHLRAGSRSSPSAGSQGSHTDDGCGVLAKGGLALSE